MIEAVNASVASSSVLRPVTEQASVARSYAVNPERVQEIAQAPYVSPYISMDLDHNKAVLQIRDGDTGDVLKQFPSDSALEFRSRQIARQSTQTFELPEVDVDTDTSSGSSSPSSAPQVSQAPQLNAQAQVAAAALASTAAQAQAVSAPPTSGNVVVTA